MVKHKGEEPASRGIPSKKSLWFEYGKLPMAVTARWEYEDVLQLVFPPWAQRAQYDIAVKLVRFLSDKESVDGNELAHWAGERQIPNSTLRNLVIPKMIRTGLLARERVNPTGQTERDKKHKMVLMLSTRFGEALKHAGSEWSSLVETWRIKRKKEGENEVV
ncbi:MAG: hypothetical protein V1811_02070 [Candidatus Micrarchaeota archaeon]